MCHIYSMAALVESPRTVRVTAKTSLSANGRIVIPAAIREQLGLATGDTLLMDVEDGVLRIESYPARIRRIQREFAPYAIPGVLASDELIAERRVEARREEEEELARNQQIEQARLRNLGMLG
jgi:AbrB family looped-hinge helix DNA binding protein